ncbi:MAG: hypothetical protein R3244_04815, partial [Thermoanaerobaculia bacterium]|nr:hypothetical protein [Thermoanaerobaculia bacterium]
PTPAPEPAETATTETASVAEPKPTDPTTPPSEAPEAAPVEPAEAVDPEPAARPATPPAAPTAGDPLPGDPIPPADEESGPPEVEELPVDRPSRVPPALERQPAEPEAEDPTPPAVEKTPREEAEPPAAPSMEAATEEDSTSAPDAATPDDPATDIRTAPPPPARPAEAIPEPTDDAGIAARLPRFLRSAAGGTCPECEAGEWAVAAEQEAARAGESRSEQQCSQAFVEGAAAAAQLLADRSAPRLESYVGPLLTAMWRLRPEDRAAAEDLLGPRTDPSSHCQLAGVVLPDGSEFSGYVIEAWDVLGGRSCLAGFDCAVGQSRWLGEPEVFVGEERTVVYGIFKNRSTRRERRARLTVYFRPPSDDWTPSTR